MIECPSEKVYDIDVADIDVNHLNVRRHDRDTDLQSLAASIKRDGQLQPVVLVGRHEDKGRRKLIVGQRRFLAIRDVLKWTKIKAVYLNRTVSDDEARRLSLAENLHRVSLNAADQMQAITSVFLANGRSVHRTALQLGVTDQTVRNWVKLDDLATPRIKELLKSRKLRPTDARRVIEAAHGDAGKADALAGKIGGKLLHEKLRIVQLGKAKPTATASQLLAEAAKPGQTKHIMLYLPDEVHGALESAAKALKTASDDIALRAVTDWLKANGYLP